MRTRGFFNTQKGFVFSDDIRQGKLGREQLARNASRVIRFVRENTDAAVRGRMIP